MKIKELKNKKGAIKRSTIVILLIVIIALSTMVAILLTRYLREEKHQFNLVQEINIDGGLDGADGAIGIVYDSVNDNIFVTGYVAAPGDSLDIWIAKYNTDLGLIKNVTVNGSADGNDMGYTLDLDGNGNLFIVGYISETAEMHNIWLAKYDLNLNLLKNITINGDQNDTDEGYGIIVDNDGNVFIAGTITNAVTGYDIYLAKYDNNLNLLNTQILNGPANSTDKGRFLAFDSTGKLYVSGSMSQVGSNYDIWVGKFNNDLNYISQMIIAGPTTGEDKGYGIFIDDSDTLYITGTMTETDEGYNIWLAKFSTTDFYLIESVTYNGPVDGEDVAYSMFLNDDGFIYLAGVYTEIVGGSNILIAKCNTDLELVNLTTVNGWSNAYDTGYGIIKGPGNHIFVTGILSNELEGQNIWIAKYNIS